MTVILRKQLVQYFVFIAVVSFFIWRKTNSFLFFYFLPVFVILGIFVKTVPDKLVKILNFIVSLFFKSINKIILAVIFFFILSPLAFIRRAIKKENILWIKKPEVDSFWKECDGKMDEDYFKQMF